MLLILALSLGPIYEFLLSYLRYKPVTLAECIKSVLYRLSIAAIVYPFIALWFGFSNIIAQDESKAQNPRPVGNAQDVFQ
ncbi:MAG: hypothetical protein H6628_03605 [Calditrichae bacterium]|nr:hypothetical protein [Calditrichia bacterium]